MKWINKALKAGFAWNMRRIQYFMRNPNDSQQQVFNRLVQKAEHTIFGREHHFSTIRNYQDFKCQIPIRDYQELEPYIKRMMLGESNVLWPGNMKWFSRSSGTTSSHSKYLPVSTENLKSCHLQGGHDMMSMWYNHKPDTQLFSNSKGIITGGELSCFDKKARTYVGDVSAVMIQNMPFYAKYFLTPDVPTALMKDWEAKIDKIARVAVHQNVTNISGVPTWTLLLFQKILKLSGKEHLSEVYPNFELYTHGGVQFEPYRAQSEQLFPNQKVSYRNSYNASEGFFAGQLSSNTDAMLLFLDNGVFFEFIPLSDMNQSNPQTYTIEEVETGINYAVVISTNAGLWRYALGDTVLFTSLYPHQIQVTGRTAQFINVFGEELMVWNTDKALTQTCSELGASIADYTVAPIFMSKNTKGGHEWLIEFVDKPEDKEAFTELLDQNLQNNNSDYAAKRQQNMALGRLTIQALPKGTFHNWMRSKGKLGGQHKVPKLANDRRYLNEILKII